MCGLCLCGNVEHAKFCHVINFFSFNHLLSVINMASHAIILFTIISEENSNPHRPHKIKSKNI